MPQPLYAGALEGFGNLGSALLLAPKLAQQRRDTIEEKFHKRRAEENALAQALKIHEAGQEAKRQEREDRKAEFDARRDDEKLNRALREREFTSQDEARKAEAAAKMRDDVGAVGKYVLGDILGIGKERKPVKKDTPPEPKNIGTAAKPKFVVWNDEAGGYVPFTQATMPQPAPPEPVVDPMATPPGWERRSTTGGEILPPVVEPTKPATPVARALGITGKPPVLPTERGWYNPARYVPEYLGGGDIAGNQSAEKFNAEQDASLEAEAFKTLSPADQAVYQRVLDGGDPARIAEARRRLMSLAGR